MGAISNRFYVTSIKDGTVVNAVLYSDKALSQLINTNTGASSPDWTQTNYQPHVYCVTRKGATMAEPSTFKFLYNGTELEWSRTIPVRNDVCTNLGNAFMFYDKQVTDPTTNTTYTFPGVKIVKNQYSIMQNDNNVITCQGTMTLDGATIEYSVSTPVRVSVLSGSGNFGWISGDSYVTAQSGTAGTATMYAQLATSEGASVSSFYTKWFIEGADPSERWPSTGRLIQATDHAGGFPSAAECDIYGSEITGWAVVRCEYYLDSNYTNKAFTAYWDVDDLEDTEELYICSFDEGNIRGGLDLSLRATQSAQFVAWMGKNGDQTAVDARYTNFQCRLIDGNGNTITGELTDVSAAGSSATVTTNSGGWFNITTSITSPVTATGGKVVIPATFVDNHHGKITGIITASTTE